MQDTHKKAIKHYISDAKNEILSINYIKGGKISKDSLTVHYYRSVNGEWRLNTDSIAPDGTVEQKSIKAIRH